MHLQVSAQPRTKKKDNNVTKSIRALQNNTIKSGRPYVSANSDRKILFLYIKDQHLVTSLPP